MTYQPSQKILAKYADILVNFALNQGKGIKKGEIVQLIIGESAKPLLVELRKAILKAGGHMILKYLPEDDEKYNLSKDFYDLASDKQIEFFPRKFLKAQIETIDHMIGVISEQDKHALKDVDPAKIMLSNKTMKPYLDWRRVKENQGKFSWTLALYGTSAMAQEAKLSLQDYWQQIIKACFLDEENPIKKWREVFQETEAIKTKLLQMQINKLHIISKNIDLWIKLGEKRKWLSGIGNNIPSFEIFTSPDFKGTDGCVKFNQPLYQYGNLIKDIYLKFKNGKVVEVKASRNQKLLEEMIKVKGGNQIGEFSLTDGRFSRITKFMAETLYDENVGGKNGNMHIALGSSFYDSYTGKIKQMKKKDWQKLGFNDSVIHIDIISTESREVTAHLKNGTKKVIYKDGRFVI
ncbi:aminopeptidase [Candidatus Beckwithbacteria bacterium]|nr:aminopeptidase [Candidatus Beckwithbacteria bacterium]